MLNIFSGTAPFDGLLGRNMVKEERGQDILRGREQVALLSRVRVNVNFVAFFMPSVEQFFSPASHRGKVAVFHLSCITDLH